MLEDESGRITLVGEVVRDARLVTGIIIGALGIETAEGDFEVVDICYPGMAPQAEQESVDAPEGDEDEMDVDGIWHVYYSRDVFTYLSFLMNSPELFAG
jgi:DNA polymerase delta subunit 2